MKQKIHTKILDGINRYLIFFLLVSILATCCVSLFAATLANSLQVSFTLENLSAAAGLTFVCVVVLSLLVTIFDGIRRKLTVKRTTKHIVDAAKQMIAGDFGVRVAPLRRIGGDGSLNEIIDCFNQMAQELSGVETLRTDFVSNVSHEMKTPLAVMQNYATLLQQPDVPEKERLEYAKGVSQSARRLADMMTNVLKLNRLENQKIYPKAMPYDLSEQLRQSLLLFEHIWEQKQIEVEASIAEGITIKADEELLSLVWNNLLSNAFKFTSRGGTVLLKLTADEQYVTVKVEDSGCGISADVGAHIFEKFYQGDTSHATRGNGLGLALVKRVVDIVQGEICVESALEKGTVFTVKMRR